jgi:hypothetical protein
VNACCKRARYEFAHPLKAISTLGTDDISPASRQCHHGFNFVNAITSYRLLQRQRSRSPRQYSFVAGRVVRKDARPEGCGEEENTAARLEAVLALLEAKLELLLPEACARDCAQFMHALAKRKPRASDAVLIASIELRMKQVVQSFNSQDVANTLWAYATMERSPDERVLKMLERRVAEVVEQEYSAQHVANTLWAYAKIGRLPGEEVMMLLEGRVEELVTDFNEQEVANAIWAYAKIGRSPRHRVMSLLKARVGESIATAKSQELSSMLWAFATLGRHRPESAQHVHAMAKRVEDLAGAGYFTAQEVATTLWSACVLSSDEQGPCVLAPVATALATRCCALNDSLDEIGLRQLHQVLVSCRLDDSLRSRMPSEFLDVAESLAPACREAFLKPATRASPAQLRLQDALCGMGLAVEAEARCPESGYSIDVLARGTAEFVASPSSNHTWAVEFDGPSHFLACGAPKGATLIKQHHLRKLGYTLVSIPHWEWREAEERGLGDQGQSDGLQDYLRTKLFRELHLPLEHD